MCRSILLFVFLTALCVRSAAQLCTGSLGDPIVHISFGSGVNPGPALPTAGVAYQYVANDCPNDGSYTVRSSTYNCFGSTWHNVPQDHTGDPAGYFMMVNASFTPGDFYVDTVRGLCSGTTYEFAAWVMNVSRNNGCNGVPNRPNITFRLERTDGTLLRTYNSGDVPLTATPQWNQYGFFFTTPATLSDVVVRMVNNAPGGCGNDLLLDDITFRPCGPLLTPSFSGSPGPEQHLCFGQSAVYDLNVALSAGYINPRFQWQRSVNGGPWTDLPTAATAHWVVPFGPATLPGSYRYRLTVAESANWGNATCTVASQPLTVTVHALPEVSVTGPASACAGAPVSFLASGAATYSWRLPSGADGSPSDRLVLSAAAPADAGTYVLTGASLQGCTDDSAFTFVVHPRPAATVAADTVAICRGSSALLSAAGGGSYAWWPADGLSDPASATPLASPADSTAYQVIVTNGQGCADTAYVQVNVRPGLTVDAGPDRSLMRGDAVRLAGSVTGTDYSVEWRPPYALTDPLRPDTEARPLQDTAYVLVARSLAGCGEVRDTVRIRVFRKVEVPNVFTPNGDGINDSWEIPALEAYRNFTLDIFNRWGQPVLRRRNDPRSWTGELNGKALPTGTYYYVLYIADTGQRLSGPVDLIR
ncbi:MAG: T9SS type B sorting domain-containing protein [Chitinophagaceae bacterium]|nr:MAG: T9SS type B sorting domain-containing protein [Chitinophagaceae bacterium]